MMECLSVCVSRKMITSSWESPVTTWTPHNHPVQLQVSFDGSRLVFHGSMSVFIGFQGFRLVSRWFMVFHGFWLVSMGFRGGFMVFHRFWLVSMVFQGGFMVFMFFGWFSWFCWLRTPQNCILAERSSLGLAGLVFINFWQCFIQTRPKPAYGRQGLDWIFGPKKWCKNVTVTNRGVQLTSFDPKNVTLPIGGSNCPLLVQKTWRYQQGGPTDLLWSKKCDRYQQGGPTDLLWSKKRDRYQQGVQLTF